MNWASDPSRPAQLLGIVAAMLPRATEDLTLPPLTIQAEGRLIQWLQETVDREYPYALAQTIQGLRLFDEEQARTLVQRAVDLDQTEELLHSANLGAVTSLSQDLLKDTLDWLAEM